MSDVSAHKTAATLEKLKGFLRHRLDFDARHAREIASQLEEKFNMTGPNLNSEYLAHVLAYLACRDSRDSPYPYRVVKAVVDTEVQVPFVPRTLGWFKFYCTSSEGKREILKGNASVDFGQAWVSFISKIQNAGDEFERSYDGGDHGYTDIEAPLSLVRGT
jgi:hypothetical protein